MQTTINRENCIIVIVAFVCGSTVVYFYY